MKVKIKVLDEFKHLDLVPKKATIGSAGFDLKSAEDAVVQPGCRVPVRNGILLEIPDGWEGQVRPRSGNARKHGISIPNSPATIDSDYRGELVTTLINHGKEPFVVRAGDRIAQILFAQVPDVAFEVVEELSGTARGAGGFGSTGR